MFIEINGQPLTRDVVVAYERAMWARFSAEHGRSIGWTPEEWDEWGIEADAVRYLYRLVSQ